MMIYSNEIAPVCHHVEHKKRATTYYTRRYGMRERHTIVVVIIIMIVSRRFLGKKSIFNNEFNRFTILRTSGTTAGRNCWNRKLLPFSEMFLIIITILNLDFPTCMCTMKTNEIKND